MWVLGPDPKELTDPVVGSSTQHLGFEKFGLSGPERDDMLETFGPRKTIRSPSTPCTQQIHKRPDNNGELLPLCRRVENTENPTNVQKSFDYQRKGTE